MNRAPDIDWDFVRDAEFPVARNWAYFDHAAVAPLPRRSGERAPGLDRRSGEDGVVNWPENGAEPRVESATGSPALINAHRDEIAFVNSTTHGIGLIAEGYPLARTGKRSSRRPRNTRRTSIPG